MDCAVYQEFSDDVLIAKGFEQPHRQFYVLFESLADELDVCRNRCPALGTNGYGKHEAYLEFQDFKLIAKDAATKNGGLERHLLGFRIVQICGWLVLIEDLLDVCEELFVKDVLSEPESSIFLNNLVLDHRCDLNLC